MFGGIDTKGKKPASPFEKYLLEGKAGETRAERVARIMRDAGRRNALNPLVRTQARK
ncbi:hypothetical protein HY992_06045 [Candidatus Micrarchaeota archaeon]|nr:hypothetical protein [Candidatus Micrarchaeota archaeon]